MSQPLNLESTQANDTADREQPSEFRAMRKFGIEVAIEFGLLVICAICALTWNAKLGIALAIACFRFAVADIVTAILVVRYDPCRLHGVGVAALFVAMGFLRASLVGAIALGISTFLMICWDINNPGNAGVRNNPLFLPAFGVAVTNLYGYLLLVFPLALISFCCSLVARIPLSFAMGLTKLRRAEPSKRNQIVLEQQKGIGLIGLSSSTALLLILITAFLIFVPPFNFLFFSLIWLSPIGWFLLFTWVVQPKDN